MSWLGGGSLNPATGGVVSYMHCKARMNGPGRNKMACVGLSCYWDAQTFTFLK